MALESNYDSLREWLMSLTVRIFPLVEEATEADIVEELERGWVRQLIEVALPEIEGEHSLPAIGHLVRCGSKPR